ncbi:sorbin and SH3 domain-containing protein 2-like isoform X28, partial [Leptotrombidium deliense]
QSEEEILSPSEDFVDTCVEALGKPVAELEAGPSSRSADHGDLTPSDIPFAISPQSEESDMSSVTKPSFKARAPKNIWSPGSTTTTSSESTTTTIPATTASATQTTPTKVDAKASTLPHGFRPVSFEPSELEPSLLAIDTSLANSNPDTSLLSPSSVSETSIDTSKQVTSRSPQSPITKYWTLPRHASKEDYNAAAIRQVVTDKAPPPEAHFLYETPTTKYYTLPTAVTEKTTTAISAPKKFEGIGPTDESGLPISLRTEEFREDWYKTMFNKLHKFEKPKSDLDEPIRIKLRSHKPEYHFSPKYFEEEDRGPTPRNIADYEPGHSSISLREKQMAEQREKEMHDEHDSRRRPPVPYHRNCVFNALTSTNGYESDSSYIIKKKEPKTVPTPASRSTYCAVQRGDIDIPFGGLQKPAPQPRSHKDSKHKYDEEEVNIHFRSPIRQLVKDDSVTDEQLAKRQREQMRRFYENDFEKRHVKESQTNAQRRHHFTPKQEHIVHLDRYQRAYSEKETSQLEHNLLARVLFDFHALSSRELSAKKGDIVIVHRPVNHNWVEVEDSQSGLKGLVPRNYLDFEKEGSAKAKYDFEAKTPVEIQLKKSEIIRLLRKVDENWFEGINSKGDVGIFPCSYVEIFKPPLYLQLNNNRYSTYRPLSPPEQYSRSLSPVCPPSPSRLSRSVNGTNHAHKVSEGTAVSGKKLYRVLYPYKPQQGDELELLAGDILTVTMHCDDGWFVGHSTLTGQYGTFPGNYVELLM